MSIRHPLHYKTLFHITRQCGSSEKRQEFLRREITIIRENVRIGQINKWMACNYLDAIATALEWKP